MWTDEKAAAMALLKVLQRDNPATRMLARQIGESVHYEVSLDDMHAAVRWMDTQLTDAEYGSRFDGLAARIDKLEETLDEITTYINAERD